MCSSLPARLMGEFQASKVYLQYATWLTGKFPSRGISSHFWPVWVRPRDKIQTFSGGREGYRNMGVAKRLIYPFRGWGSFWQKTHARYSTHQIPTDTHSYIFPSNTFHLWTYYFFQNLIQQKLAWRTYIFLETDLLGAPDACYGCKKFWSTCWFSYLFIF